MAKSIFKNMTPAQRTEARKQARLNKKKPPATEPRFTRADTNRGRREEVEAAKKEVVPRGYQPPPESEVQKAAVANENFEDIFLSIVQFLPPDQQGRAFSLFSVFRQQSPEDQRVVIDSLMEVAREQTGPLFDLYKKRIEEDSTYNKAILDRQRNNAKANYDRLVQTVDTNALRDKAKEDRNMAKVIRTITNTAFVDRVAGSGIQRRRTQEQIEAAQLAKDDIATKAVQTKGAAGQSLGQIEQDIQAKIEREDVLRQRDLYDENQKQEEASRSLFLSLFENQFANAGDNARDNVESGDIDPTTGKPGSDVAVVPGGVADPNIRASDMIRSDVFQSGGTDAQRRTRGAEEVRVKNASAEDARLNKLLQDSDSAIGRLFDLNRYKRVLQMTNRNTAEVDAEMARLMPVAQLRLNSARKGEGSFRGSSGSGLPGDLAFFLKQDADSYVFDDAKLVGRYGTTPMNRGDIGEELRRFSSVYNSDTFGKEFVDLDKQWGTGVYIPGESTLNNRYGSTAFNESLRGPVPAPTSSLTNPRVDVLSASTAAPRVATPLAPTIVNSALRSGWTDGLTSTQQVQTLGNMRKGVQPAPTTVVVNPNTGKAYTGAAAKRLASRL